MTQDPCNEKTRSAVLLLGIGVLALACRTAVAVLTTSWSFSENWAFGYEMGEIGASLTAGDGFSWLDGGGPTAWMPPIYPIVIAAAFKIFGTYTAEAAISLLIFQTVASILTCFFLYLIGRQVFNANVGMVAAVMFALYPASVHFTVQKIWSTALFACCLSLLIIILIKLRTQPTLAKALWVGLLSGFLALVDPVILAAFPLIAVWLYVNSRQDRLATCKIVALVFIVTGLTISPWLVRNYVAFGQYVFVKSNFGNELFIGNNPHASGSFTAAHDARANLTIPEQEFLRQADEPSRNRFFLHKGIAFIAAHPAQFSTLTVNRFAQYWTFMMQPVQGSAQKISLLIYFGVLLLAITGLLLSSKREADVQLLWLLLLALPLPYYCTVVGLFRYRFAVEMILLLFAAYGISRIVYWLRASFTGLNLSRARCGHVRITTDRCRAEPKRKTKVAEVKNLQLQCRHAS